MKRYVEVYIADVSSPELRSGGARRRQKEEESRGKHRKLEGQR